MNALLIILFVIGIATGLFMRHYQAPQEQPKQMPSEGTKLDIVDEMFLYGEVNGDDFYRM